jgi:hypothetical protein
MYQDFYDITGYDIADFFQQFATFVNNDSQNIIDYYSGIVPTMNRDSLAIYKNLLQQSNYLLNLFDLDKERLTTVDFWTLIDFADDIRIKLETIGNFSKYARSSVQRESFNQNTSVELATRDNETLESMISRLGSNDKDNDWVTVALSNQVIEESYTLEGGIILRINMQNNTNFNIQSVLDNPDGDKIKGRDIYKILTFIVDPVTGTGDLQVLSYDDTLHQIGNILTNLRKNDNPEFPYSGMDASLIAGMNFKTVAIPSIIRQIYQTFSTDDIIQQIEILNSKSINDSLFLELNIKTKSGQTQLQTLNVNGN